MLFNDEFVESLKIDPVGGTLRVCNQVGKVVLTGGNWTEGDYEVLLEAYALILEIRTANLLSAPYPALQVTGIIAQDSSNIFDYLKKVEEYCNKETSKLRFESLQSRFRATLGSGFAYEFSQGDLDRVQSLINELRELISDATGLEKEHQQRLLKRLERLQAEMHKKVSDLDRFWGLVGDAGVVLGKLGQDAKPIIDRIREIADIVWQTQSRAEELPSGTQLPSLEHRPSRQEV